MKDELKTLLRKEREELHKRIYAISVLLDEPMSDKIDYKNDWGSDNNSLTNFKVKRTRSSLSINKIKIPTEYTDSLSDKEKLLLAINEYGGKATVKDIVDYISKFEPNRDIKKLNHIIRTYAYQLATTNKSESILLSDNRGPRNIYSLRKNKASEEA